MLAQYKIEIHLQTNTNEYIWCIIKYYNDNFINVGHGISYSVTQAAQDAYHYYTYNIQKNNI